ncbi:AI-2E family transporter [Mangrovimicrobium sediminis]|uniref:AI-2E family transporter n=1 Tax=Mangrovimicrobium sediminis TaxID=2562682 RepID=A0A4Z0LZ75_9GAMM|nr:AI-2E family transporter [Haliea sp. SAOS-164]TGD72683.1 AI-2E family transporter [Haliea sp. SAOS-164]
MEPAKEQPTTTSRRPNETIDLVIRLGLVALMIWLSLKIFSPFIGLMVWAIVLAIALYPLNQKIAARTGGSNGRAALLMVTTLVLVLGVPTALLAASFVDHMLSLYHAMAEGTLVVPAPKATVQEWPLVGERVYAAWQAAADNFAEFAQDHAEQIRTFSRNAAGAMGSSLTTMLAFIGAFIIAGIMMAYADPGEHTTRRIFTRVCGPRVGPELHTLSVATIRSVAVGVIGVAFIQAVLLGIGFLAAGIPAAGLLAIIALLLGIAQVPAALIVIPVIAWVWLKGDASTLSNTLVTVYLLVAGLADNVLKPLLLGRGLAVPMPVVLLGAIGGMLSLGLIGLFVGAVILAVSYQIFMAWVDEAEPADASEADTQ